MNLPAVQLQWVALCLGWGIVLSCVSIEVLCRLWPRASGRAILLVGVLALASAALPGAASAAYWLGLAFQWPSTMLVLLAGARCVHRFRAAAIDPMRPRSTSAVKTRPAKPLFPVQAALPLLVAAVVLYAGTFGFGGFAYSAGYRDTAVLVLATMLVFGWYWLRPRANAAACFVSLALLLHVGLRLPTGNAWDALIDPFVAMIALIVCLRSARSLMPGTKSTRMIE